MADEFSVTVEGIEETCAMLASAPKKLVKGAYGKALTAAAVPVVQALQGRIPVAEYPAGMFESPGSLADSLVTDVAIDSDGKGGQVQIGFGKQGSVARLVEYGHRAIGHAPNKRELGMVQAHPFMRPAAAEAAEASIEAFGESIRESLEESKVLEQQVA